VVAFHEGREPGDLRGGRGGTLASRWIRRPDLDGCRDVDIEASACTNTTPIHRLGLEAGDSADTPAVYVRWLDLSVERLEQEYHRLDEDKRRLRFDYRAPRFDYAATLVFDRSGLVLSYPSIASRAARSTAALTFAGADITGARESP
jgi:uncharacterized protein